MKKIESFLQLENMINTYKHGAKGIYTNCFVLRNELEKLISEERLYFDCSTNALQIICDEEVYYHLYFYASLKDDFHFSEFDKPVLCDMLCTTVIREKDALAQRKIEESGFKLHAENRQFVISISKQVEQARSEFDKLTERMTDNGYHLKAAEKEDFMSIYNLWKRNLDAFVFRAVGKEEWEGAFSEKKIHCIKDACGNICAARWYENINKNSWEHHVTVDEMHRGMGFARILLLQQMIAAETEDCNQVLCWIEKNNHSSIKLHGFWGDFNNKISKQYVKYN